MTLMDDLEFANNANIKAARRFKAERDALVKALQFIADGYANHNINHVDYRVKVYQVALDALERLSVKVNSDG